MQKAKSSNSSGTDAVSAAERSAGEGACTGPQDRVLIERKT